MGRPYSADLRERIMGDTFTNPGAVQESGPDTTVHNVDGSVTRGHVRYLNVTLQPMEAQILGSARG